MLSGVQLFCNPTDCSLPGSSVCGISQARILEWVATSFSRGSFQSPGSDQRSNPRYLCLLHWQADSLPLVLPGKPLILYSFGSDSKESTRNAGDRGSILGLGRFPGEGNGNRARGPRLGLESSRSEEKVFLAQDPFLSKGWREGAGEKNSKWKLGREELLEVTWGRRLIRPIPCPSSPAALGLWVGTDVAFLGSGQVL